MSDHRLTLAKISGDLTRMAHSPQCPEDWRTWLMDMARDASLSSIVCGRMQRQLDDLADEEREVQLLGALERQRAIEAVADQLAVIRANFRRAQ